MTTLLSLVGSGGSLLRRHKRQTLDGSSLEPRGEFGPTVLVSAPLGFPVSDAGRKKLPPDCPGWQVHCGQYRRAVLEIAIRVAGGGGYSRRPARNSVLAAELTANKTPHF